MNSNKAGNPGKIVSTFGMVWGKKNYKFYYYRYMVLGKKFRFLLVPLGWWEIRNWSFYGTVSKELGTVFEVSEKIMGYIAFVQV